MPLTPAELDRAIIGALGDFADRVTVWAYPAREVSARKAAGAVGTVVAGVLEVRALVSEELDVGVATEEVTFQTDALTAGAIRPRASSIESGGRLYDVLRAVRRHPGGVDFILRELR